MIGQKVTVKVDRPLGSYHPNHKDIYYPINYGYIEGIIAPDGEEQDAYILGVDDRLKNLRGLSLLLYTDLMMLRKNGLLRLKICLFHGKR